MATYRVVQRDAVWHTRDEQGNVIAYEIKDSGYTGDDLYAAGIDLDARRLIARAGEGNEWGIETDDPDYQGDEGIELMYRHIGEGTEEAQVYDHMVDDLGIEPDEARRLMGWPDEELA